jgi:hypothetical protein
VRAGGFFYFFFFFKIREREREIQCHKYSFLLVRKLYVCFLCLASFILTHDKLLCEYCVHISVMSNIQYHKRSVIGLFRLTGNPK